MNYTPQQVMVAIGVGQQTLRYWRKALAPLAERHGQTAFTFSDLLALKVVYRLVVEGGMNIGAVASLASELFAACRTPTPLDHSSDLILILRPKEGRVQRVNKTTWRGGDAFEITIPLGPCVDELLESLRGSAGINSQLSLPLPLTSVSMERRR